MGASLTKSCLVGSCFEPPVDTPRLPPRRATPPHFYGQRAQQRVTSPAKLYTDAYGAAHPQAASSATRKQQQQHQQYQYHQYQNQNQYRCPPLERWGSRESTCSSSSDDELALRGIARVDTATSNSYDNKQQQQRRRRRPAAHVRPHPSYPETNSKSKTTTSGKPIQQQQQRPSSSSSSSSVAVGFEELLPANYVVGALVGTGTTAKCYRCVRTSDNRAFACKVINKKKMALESNHHHQSQRNNHLSNQLRREIEVLKRLDHPNIAKLEDSFENDTYIILVMELLDGGELFDTIIDRVKLKEDDAKRIATSLLSAMQYMHAQGIVHRDLKPENVLLSSSSSSGEVKIIDFGFASTCGMQTKMTSFLGTGGYLAPEILLQRPYTFAVDSWSFGVLLYLMLCGRLPFTTSTQLQPGQRISKLFRLTFPEKYWAGVSSSAKDLVQKLLVLNPSHRLSPTDALGHRWFHSQSE